MTVEAATYISQLNSSLPTGSDPKAEGDDHVRLTKLALRNTFVNFTAAPLNSSNTQLDKVVSAFSVSPTAPAAAMAMDASGNVGIGTTLPSVRLDIRNPGSQTNAAIRADAGKDAALNVSGNGNSLGATSFDLVQDAANVAYVFNRANESLLFGTNNAERVRISASGNVGIGTTTPAVRLDIRNAGTQTNAAIRADSGQIAILNVIGNANTLGGTSFDMVQDGGNVAYLFNRANAGLVFGTNNTERARFDSSGNFIKSLTTSAPALAANREMVFALTSNTNLQISVRGSDGVTRTANITLA